MFGSAMMMRSGDGKEIRNSVDEVGDYSVHRSRMRVKKTYIAIYSPELVGVVARETMRRKNHENLEENRRRRSIVCTREKPRFSDYTGIHAPDFFLPSLNDG